MSLLHFIRKATNRILLPVGLAVERVEKQSWFRPKITTTRVGRFSIQVPSINPLSTLYTRNPDYTGHLGRLTTLLKRKYPELAAIDIGANVGDTACIIKSAEDIPILCIEGDDSIFGLLVSNLKQFQNVSVHKLFLGEKTGVMSVTMEKTGWNATLTPDASGTAAKIKVVSLDDFLDTQVGTINFKLVKIDTEGFDCSIIRGARKFIERAHPVITFEYNRDNMDAIGEPGLDTLFMLAELGYSRIIFHDEFGRFLCSTTLAERSLIRDLHAFADGKHGSIYYYDITTFHETDSNVALAFAAGEQKP